MFASSSCVYIFQNKLDWNPFLFYLQAVIENCEQLDEV